MTDNQINELIKAIKDLVEINTKVNTPGVPSSILASFQQDSAKDKSDKKKQQEKEQKLQRETQKIIEKYEKDQIKEQEKFYKLFSSKSFFKDLGRYVENSRRKSALRKKLPDADEQTIDILSRRMPNFKGISNGGIFGALGSTVAAITAMAKLAKNFTAIATIIFDIFAALGEQKKFFVPSIRQGSTSTQELSEKSIATLQNLRNPLVSGAYANNSGFKNAVANIMSSGVLNDATVKDSEILIKSFRFIASQGLLLGDTFEETARNFSDIASVYNLSFGSQTNQIDNYTAINKMMVRGIAEGLSKSGLRQLLLQYNKSTAVSQGGLIKVFRDLNVMFNTIKDVSSNKDQMPYFATIFQNLMSSRLSSLGTFAALVDDGNSYSTKELGKLAKSYQDSSPLAQKTIALRNLLNKSGFSTSEEDIALMTELHPEFSAFRDEKSRQVLQKLVKNANINKNFLNDTANLSSKQFADWVINNTALTNEQRAAIETMAQSAEVMANPLQTLVSITQGILNMIYTLIGSPVLKITKSDVKLGGAERFIEGYPTKTSKALSNSNGNKDRS